MRALVVQEKGGVQINDVAVPIAGEGEVRIKLKAAAINKRDYWISIGKYPGIKQGITLGSDGAGIIDRIGDGVNSSFLQKPVIINPNINWGNNPDVQSSNYHILGMPTNGTFAEYVVVNVDRVMDIPTHLSFETAAALPLAGLTAFRACFYHGGLKDGDKVLITGFGGGVAHLVFLFTKALEVNVSITSGNKTSLDLAKKLGADHSFNYLESDWSQQASSAEQGYDLIIDSAGGDQFNEFIKLLNPGGKIVFYGATNGLPSKLDLFRLFWKQGKIQGTTMGSDKEFEQMINFVEQNKIMPIISDQNSFAEIVKAIGKMGESSEVGKSVISF